MSKKFNFEEYRRRVSKKEVKEDVEELANELERFLFGSKVWVVSVILPTLEILRCIAELLGSKREEDPYDRYEEVDEWRHR